MTGARELPTIPHRCCQWRCLNDRCSSARVKNRIVKRLAMRNAPEEADGFMGCRTLVQHQANDQDADQPGPDGPVVDEVQADAKAVLIHSIDATGKSIGEREAGVYTIRL